jgi:hypothetical protein
MYNKEYFKQLKDIVDEMQKEVEITTSQLEIAREWVIVNSFSNIHYIFQLLEVLFVVHGAYPLIEGYGVVKRRILLPISGKSLSPSKNC